MTIIRLRRVAVNGDPRYALNTLAVGEFALYCSVLRSLVPVLVLCVVSCGRGGGSEAVEKADAAQATPTPEAMPTASASVEGLEGSGAAEAKKPLYDYDVDLLKHPDNSINLATEFTVEAELSGSPRRIVKSLVAIESANVETWEDVEKNEKFLKQPIIDAFSGRSAEFVRSPEVKLKIKEEIVRNMRTSPILTHKAIKNAYILQVLINISP